VVLKYGGVVPDPTKRLIEAELYNVHLETSELLRKHVLLCKTEIHQVDPICADQLNCGVCYQEGIKSQDSGTSHLRWFPGRNGKVKPGARCVWVSSQFAPSGGEICMWGRYSSRVYKYIPDLPWI